VPAEEPQKEEVSNEVEAVEEEDSILLPIVLFAGVNLLLIGGGLAAWLVIRKRRATQEESLLDEYDVDEPAGSKSQEGTGDPDETVVQDAPEMKRENAA